MIGIYQIKSILNHEVYIGSSVDVKKRWRSHRNSLIADKHHSVYLQRHCNKYGIEDLEFSIIELCEKEELVQKEQHYLDTFSPKFNVLKKADSSLGVKRRPETIEKVRNANLGLKHPAWRNKIKSKAQGGENHWTKKRESPFNQASKLKMSTSQKKLYENGYKNPVAKTVFQYDLNGVFIKEWESANKAVLVYGKGIKNNLTNKNKSAYGYIWKYKKTS